MAGLGLLLYKHVSSKPHITQNPSASITSLPTQQKPSTSNKASTAPNSVNQGTATDTKGQNSDVSTPSSQWTQSQSGLITVKSPAYGTTVKSGDQLLGSAQENQVQFRLIDDQAGVIAQGFLTVVNGNFSGNLNFSPHSNSGRLDVFTTGPTGEEVNEAQVPVKF
jgi:hypothetical protein